MDRTFVPRPVDCSCMHSVYTPLPADTPLTETPALPCSFGRDTENSTVMTLSAEGVSCRAGLPLEGMAVHLRLPASAADRLSG